jgi:hypothetical protein
MSAMALQVIDQHFVGKVLHCQPLLSSTRFGFRFAHGFFPPTSAVPT